MAQGRSVVHTNTYSNNPFNHTISDVTYNDGSTEQFGPSSGYVPQPGDIEDLDVAGIRVGWHSTTGYISSYNYGSYPTTSSTTFTIPYPGTYQYKYQSYSGSGTTHYDQPTLMDMKEFWEKIVDDFFIVEVKEHNIKEVGCFSDALLNYVRCKKLYGAHKVTITKLSQEAAKILYGKNENTNK